MAVISKITLPNGNTYDLKDRAVLQSKTYTGVTCTANTDPAGWLYFFKVVPSSATAQAYIKYRVTAVCAGVSDNKGTQVSEVEFYFWNSAVRWYRTVNGINDTSYRPFYNHIVYRAKSAGITSGYGHIVGLRFQSSYNPNTAANSRTVTYEILEATDCTVTFFDSPILYANAPGTGSTNYDGRTEYNGTTQGDTHSGDATDISRLGNNYTCYKAKAAVYRYVILLTYDEQYLLPVNSVNNDVGTSKTLTTLEFDPFGEIYYNNSQNTTAADGNIGDWYGLRVHESNLCDLRYSFNTGTTLTARKPIFLVCSPQSNGKAKLHSSPISQTLPTTDDGLIYIYLGRAYDTYRFIFNVNRPVYYYKNGAIRKWTNMTAVAATGSYNDLSNKPTIPAAVAVKGNSESSYRTGNVNLTAANIGAAASSHTHGNIQNGGTLQTTDITIASGDKLVVTDSSDSSKVARTSVAFDGSTTTQFLSKKGTFETPSISVSITENTEFNISGTTFKINLVT